MSGDSHSSPSGTGKVHPCHRRVPLRRVCGERIYPLRSAVAPLTRYIKARVKRTSPETSFPQTIVRMLQTMAHYYPRENDVIWATVPRSGHNWVAMIYTIVMERVFTERTISLAEVRNNRPHVYRHVSIRYDLGDHLTPFYFHLPVPRLMHTHASFMAWLGTRKILLQVRNPEDVFISAYYHMQHFARMDFQQYLATTSTSRELVNFFNSWGDAIESGQIKACYVVRYENFKSDPVAEMQRILDFLGVSQVSSEVIEQALEQTRIERVRDMEIKEKGQTDVRRLHFARSGKVGQAAELEPLDREALHDFLRKNLRHDFGYLDFLAEKEGAK